MLQFEFNIREYKISNNKSKGFQLALGIAFLITALLFFAYKNHLNFFPYNYYLALIFVVIALYFMGLLLGCRILYPKEYLTINSRKLKYKIGWRNKIIKIYLKDIKEINITNKHLNLILKNKEIQVLDLSNFNEHAITVLKNYLNLSD